MNRRWYSRKAQTEELINELYMLGLMIERNNAELAGLRHSIKELMKIMENIRLNVVLQQDGRWPPSD